jgi:hypothetical protein
MAVNFLKSKIRGGDGDKALNTKVPRGRARPYDAFNSRRLCRRDVTATVIRQRNTCNMRDTVVKRCILYRLRNGPRWRNRKKNLARCHAY